MTPPPCLHARDRNDDIGGGRNQNRQVDRAVLFRADDLLPVDDQHRSLTLVQDFDFRDMTRFVHFCDVQCAARERRVEGVVVGFTR